MARYESLVLSTPIGSIVAIADHQALCLLQFEDQVKKAEREDSVSNSLSFKPLFSIQNELASYFAGQLKEFKTPIHLMGSPFQCQVWNALKAIEFGRTLSYKEIAHAIDKPTASRAVGGANGANRFVILIPCHRVVNSCGALGGYTGGIQRKEWLIEHERSVLDGRCR